MFPVKQSDVGYTTAKDHTRSHPREETVLGCRHAVLTVISNIKTSDPARQGGAGAGRSGGRAERRQGGAEAGRSGEPVFPHTLALGLGMQSKPDTQPKITYKTSYEITGTDILIHITMDQFLINMWQYVCKLTELTTLCTLPKSECEEPAWPNQQTKHLFRAPRLVQATPPNKSFFFKKAPRTIVLLLCLKGSNIESYVHCWLSFRKDDPKSS